MEDLQSFLIVCLSCLVSTILVRAILTKTRTTARLPPSPPALPIIGHLHLLDRLPHQAFHKISNRYGPLIHLFLGSVPCVVVSSPEMAKEFLKTQETSFLNRPNRSVLNYLSYPWSDFVFAEFGPYWKFMKKLSMSRLLGGQTLDQLLPIRRDELRRLLKLILERANEKEAVEVGGELTKLTNNVFSRMIMSKRCAENNEEGDEIRKAVNETAELLGKFNLSDYIWLCRKLDLQGYWKKSKEIHEKFDKMMEKIIEEHQEAIRKVEEKGKYKDVLGILLEILEDESSEVRLTRENIKAFVLRPTCLPSLPLPQLAQPIVATCPPLTSPKPLSLVRESRGNGRFSLRDFKSFQRREPEPFLLPFSTVAKEPKEEMKELIRLF